MHSVENRTSFGQSPKDTRINQSNNILCLTVLTAVQKGHRVIICSHLICIQSVVSDMPLSVFFFSPSSTLWLSPNTSRLQISQSYWSHNGPDGVSWLVFLRRYFCMHIWKVSLSLFFFKDHSKSFKLCVFNLSTLCCCMKANKGFLLWDHIMSLDFYSFN